MKLSLLNELYFEMLQQNCVEMIVEHPAEVSQEPAVESMSENKGFVFQK